MGDRALDEGLAAQPLGRVDGVQPALVGAHALAEAAARGDAHVAADGRELRALGQGAPLDGEDVALAARECASCEQVLAIDPLTWLVAGVCATAGAAVVGAYCTTCSGTEMKCGGAGCVGNTFYSCPCTVEDACDLCIGTCNSECNGPAGPLGPCNP